MNEAIAEILQLLRTALSTKITKYYNGFVELAALPKNYLPVLMVYREKTNQFHRGTQKSQATYTIHIRIIKSMFAQFTTAGIDDTITAQEELTDLFEKRTTAGICDSDTVIGTLERNIKGTNYLYLDNFNVDYSRTGPQANSFCVMADMTVEVTTDLVNRS